MHRSNEATQTHCYNPVAPAYWRRQLGRPRIMWLSNIQQDLKNTTLRSQKQQIWLRTALCGG